MFREIITTKFMEMVKSEDGITRFNIEDEYLSISGHFSKHSVYLEISDWRKNISRINRREELLILKNWIDNILDATK